MGLNGPAIAAIFLPQRVTKQEHRHAPQTGVITAKPWLNKERGKGRTDPREAYRSQGPLGHKHRAFKGQRPDMLQDGKCPQPRGSSKLVRAAAS